MYVYICFTGLARNGLILTVVSYTLLRLEKWELCLGWSSYKLYDLVYEGRGVFLWLLTDFGKLVCYHDLLFVFDSEV